SKNRQKMFSTRLQELTGALHLCEYTASNGFCSEAEALELAHWFLSKTKEKQGIVYVIGNGGSAGIASHFSNDLMKALKIGSQTLYDTNLLTCLANDFGYEQVFSYPLEQLLKKEDLLVAISSSGQSKNILQAAEVAKKKGIPLMTLSGFS